MEITKINLAQSFLHQQKISLKPEYFNIVEKAELRNNPSLRAQTQLYCDAEREIKVKPSVFSVGFKVEVTSKKSLPLEQMLNLEALNQFVLTGEVRKEK